MWARVNDDNVIVPTAINTIFAELNIPREEVEGVYASVPISIGHTGEDLRCDMAFEYDSGIWKKSFPSEERISLIIDDCKVVVWAVSKKNTESGGYTIPIDWIL